MTAAERLARRLVRARSGGVCEVCTRARATNYSHRIARGQGGPWTAANGVDACGSGTTGCHGWIEGHPADARDLGLRLRRHQDPTQEPVRLARVGLVLLDDDGGWTPITHTPGGTSCAESPTSTWPAPSPLTRS